MNRKGCRKTPSERSVVGELIEWGSADLDRPRRDPRHDPDLVVEPILYVKLKLDRATGPSLNLARELADVLADGTVDRNRKAYAQLGGLRGHRRSANQAQKGNRQDRAEPADIAQHQPHDGSRSPRFIYWISISLLRRPGDRCTARLTALRAIHAERP